MKNLLFALTLLLTCGVAYAQTPEAFNYQGVARNTENQPLSEENISLRISILQTSAEGDAVYVETHETMTTSLGLFALKIGKGQVVSGLISDIEWGTDDHFLQIEMDAEGGTNYQLVGTSQLLSVPYAEYAKKSGDGGQWNESELNDAALQYEGSVIVGEDASTNSLFLVNNKKPTINATSNTLIASFKREYENSSSIFNIFGYPNTNQVSNHLKGSIMLYTTSDAKDLVLCAAPQEGNIRFVTDDWANPEAERMRVNSTGLGIGTNDPKEKLHVSDGDIYIEDINKGVIMKSPNGQCWRMTVSDSGQSVFTSVICPD